MRKLSQKDRKIGKKNKVRFQPRHHSHRTAYTYNTKKSVIGMMTKANTQCSEETLKAACIGRMVSHC